MSFELYSIGFAFVNSYSGIKKTDGIYNSNNLTANKNI